MTVDRRPLPPSTAKRKASGSRCSSPTTDSLGTKRGKPSQSDLKRSLVLQRLSMLQGDNSNSNSSNTTTTEFLDKKLCSRGAVTDSSCNDHNNNNFKKSSARKRAEEVQANLQAKAKANYPSFIKNLLRSHVLLGFWLGLPKKFCTQYLPQHDATVVLEDEDGITHETNYLAGKVGLSGGWRAFSIAHHLKEGDVAVFQLIRALTLKVYIVRGNSCAEVVDGALGLVTLDAHANQAISDNEAKEQQDLVGNGTANSREQSVINNVKEEEKMIAEISCSHELGSQVLDLDGIRVAESVLYFEQVKSLESFNIVVDGVVVIDSKFPDHLRRKYYKLCCSQRSFLHEHLLKGLNHTLIVGIISETINIADAIRTTCKASSSSSSAPPPPPRSDLVIWKTTLESFQLLGMNVAFLLTQLDQKLMGHAHAHAQSKEVVDVESEYEKEAKLEEEEEEEAGGKGKVTRCNLELKLLQIKEAILEKIDVEIQQVKDMAYR
ncbi:hypothetical protein Dimus_002072 [Dionaea muscipula]